MKPYYNNSGITIYKGNALEVLKDMDSESVDMCMTSPPYWGLRDYDGEPCIWDGDDKCEHEWGNDLFERKRGNASGPTAQVGNTKKEICGIGVNQGNFCIKCNAWKGSLGLEPTFQLFIDHLIQIFDEVKRVLKDTGTCWVNLGDTYQSTAPNTKNTTPTNIGNIGARDNFRFDSGLQPKSLIGIPERFAIAMTDAGWIRRNTIIWYKPNCMPSSADDRFTVDFEYLYFFTKKTQYWFERQFESRQGNTHSRGSKRTPPIESAGVGHKHWCKYMTKDDELIERNKRCVWKISTQSYSEAHFATYPEELVYTPIKAGCPKGGTVLDPFMGSGTTLKVARELGRKGIGIELNEEYIDMALKRIDVKQGVFQLVLYGFNSYPFSVLMRSTKFSKSFCVILSIISACLSINAVNVK